MNNSVRNEAQRFGIISIVVGLAVLVLFFFLSKSGLGSAGPSAATSGSAMQSSAAAPSPAST